MSDSRSTHLSIRRDLLLRIKKLLLQILEAVYFIFFLPMSSYEGANNPHCFMMACYIFLITITQIALVMAKHLFLKRQNEYFISFRSVGYWVKCPFESLGQNMSNEVAEWKSSKDHYTLENKLVVTYQNAYYKKLTTQSNPPVFYDEEISWTDYIILGLVVGNQKIVFAAKSLVCFVIFVQVLIGMIFFLDPAAVIQMGGYCLIYFS